MQLRCAIALTACAYLGGWFYAADARSLQQVVANIDTPTSTAAPTAIQSLDVIVPTLNRKTLVLPIASSLGTNLTFSVVDLGVGPSTILMLHGFPDSAEVFRNQVPNLVAAGYRVIAPDLRGFGLSSKPQSVSDYNFLDLLGDVSAILKALGAPTNLAGIVAHDSGTSIGTVMAAYNGTYNNIPFSTQSYVMMSNGHPNLNTKYWPENDNPVRQRQMSWYTMYFNSPVAETGISGNNFAWYRTVFAPTTPTSIVNDQVTSLKQGVGTNPLGSITAALNWFRNPTTGISASSFSIPTYLPPGSRIPDIPVKTLGLIGDSDAYVTREWMRASAQYITRNMYTLELITGAGHWLTLEAPITISNILQDFIPPAAAPIVPTAAPTPAAPTAAPTAPLMAAPTTSK